MASPLDVTSLLKSGANLRKEREKPVRVAILVDLSAPEELVAQVKEALRPQTSRGLLRVEPVAPGATVVVESSADVVIGIHGPACALTASLADARSRALHAVVIALDTDADGISRIVEHPLLDTIVAEEPADAVKFMGRWLADRVPGRRLALAANFPFVRRAVALESVRATAFQNGIIGGAVIIPGADMPLMTANQAKMVLQIAAAYGQNLGVERVKELVVVLGGAYALRTVARQVLGLIPVMGWAVKAGIGYTGTLAMGHATIEYFESGADLSGLADHVANARERVVLAATRKRTPLMTEHTESQEYAE